MLGVIYALRGGINTHQNVNGTKIGTLVIAEHLKMAATQNGTTVLTAMQVTQTKSVFARRTKNEIFLR